MVPNARRGRWNTLIVRLEGQALLRPARLPILPSSAPQSRTTSPPQSLQAQQNVRFRQPLRGWPLRLTLFGVGAACARPCLLRVAGAPGSARLPGPAAGQRMDRLQRLGLGLVVGGAGRRCPRSSPRGTQPPQDLGHVRARRSSRRGRPPPAVLSGWLPRSFACTLASAADLEPRRPAAAPAAPRALSGRMSSVPAARSMNAWRSRARQTGDAAISLTPKARRGSLIVAPQDQALVAALLGCTRRGSLDPAIVRAVARHAHGRRTAPACESGWRVSCSAFPTPEYLPESEITSAPARPCIA